MSVGAPYANGIDLHKVKLPFKGCGVHNRR
jgi:hypothetical protein